jgi:hypothetical protein
MSPRDIDGIRKKASAKIEIVRVRGPSYPEDQEKPSYADCRL